VNESRPSSPGQIAGRAPQAEPDADTQLSAPDMAITLAPGRDVDATLTDGPRRPTDDEGQRLARGTMVGRCLVLDRLGSGGMGVVYAAYDPELDRKVAIKLVPKDTSAKADASSGATRLLREAQSMARLSHPNVVAVYDVGSIPAGVYISMEHIDGVTLTTWLEERPRSWREVLRVFEAAGRGIEAAHAAGLVHRDFKPDNVMIGHDGRVRVLDFGLARPAKTIDPDSSDRVESSGGWSPASHLELQLTMPGTVMGTPRYMAPEQHLGKPTDERSDIYSFCVALWEAIYGARPFSGHSLAELSIKVVAGEVDEPPKGAKVPRWLRTAVRRGMSPDPAARYPGMTELLAALGRHRQRRTGWIMGGVGLAIVAAIGGLVVFQLSRASLCDEDDSVLAGVWDRETKSKVEAAFEREGKTYTAAAFRNVERTLDEYGDSLVDMRREACEASRVHGTQSDEVLGRRMACLDRRVRRLGALTDALAEGGTTTVLRAVEAAHGLPDLALCADVERLSKGVPPPDDPNVRLRVDEIRAENDRIEGLGVAGRTDLLERLDASLAEARATEYRPLVAETLQLRGNFLGNLGRADDARASLLEGLDHAEAVGHDSMIAEISIVLIHIEGNLRNQFDVADLHARRAAAVLERLGGDKYLQVYLWTKVGTLQLNRNEEEAAVETLRRAVDLGHEIEAGGPRLLPILNPLASALMGAERYDEASEVIQEAQAIVDTDVGPEHPNAGALLALLARLRGQQDRHEEGLELFRRAREVMIAALGHDHPNVGAIMNGIGLTLSSLGRDEEALAAYAEATAIIERTSGPEHLSVATALQNMAYLEVRRGRGREALEKMLRVIEIREPKLGKESEGVAFAKDLVGDSYALLGKPDEARKYYRESIAAFEKLGKREPQAHAYVGLAKLLLAEKRAEDAVLQAERALTMEGPDSSEAGRADTRFVLAKALYATGRERARVRELVATAQAEYRKAGLSYSPELAEVKRWAEEHP
jgi:tetratricopeptide (TPR) repeat protein